MDRRELNAAIKAADAIFVWVNLTDDDGAYVEVSKAAFRRALQARQSYDAPSYNAVIRQDGEHSDLYVN